MNVFVFALIDNLLAASQSVILLSSAFKECLINIWNIVDVTEERSIISIHDHIGHVCTQ